MGTERGIHYRKLTNAIIKVDKPQELQWTTGDTAKPMAQSGHRPSSLRLRKSQHFSLILKAGQKQCHSSEMSSRCHCLSHFASLLDLFRSSVFRWDPTTFNRTLCFLVLLIQMLISTGITFMDAPRVMFDQMSGHTWPVKMTHKINNHTKWSERHRLLQYF